MFLFFLYKQGQLFDGIHIIAEIGALQREFTLQDGVSLLEPPPLETVICILVEQVTLRLS